MTSSSIPKLFEPNKASLMIFPNDFNSLVNYFSFCMWLFHTATCFTVIIFRYTRPVAQFPRLFKVSRSFNLVKHFFPRYPLFYQLSFVLLDATWLPFHFYRLVLIDKCCAVNYSFKGIRFGISVCSMLDCFWLHFTRDNYQSYLPQWTTVVIHSTRTTRLPGGARRRRSWMKLQILTAY